MHPSPRPTLLLLLAALTATGPMAIDMYLPAIPDMALALQTTEGAIQMSLMTFFLGLMLGQLLYGPLSDKFGRKPLIYLGMGVFVLGSVGCALAGDITQLQWLRFLQGLGGSIGMVISFAIVRDSYTGHAIGKAMSLILAVLGVAPVLAPMAGTLLQDLASWRLIFWVLAAYGLILVVACWRWLPETRTVGARSHTELGRTLHNYGAILLNRQFIPFAAALCIAQAGFLAYITGSASVFISQYTLTPAQFSVLFAVNAMALIAATLVNPRLHQRFGPLQVFRLANTGYFVIMALLLLGFVAGHTHIATLFTGLLLTMFLLGLLMPTGSQLALLKQGRHAGTASALLGCMQFGAGAFTAGLTGALAHFGGIALVSVMAVCAAISLAVTLLFFPRRIEL